MEVGRESLDHQLWRACAGRLAHVPTENSTAYYFPQGHAEHAHITDPGFAAGIGAPAVVPCRVAGVEFAADSDTDEVFAKISLVPLRSDEQGGLAAEEEEEDGTGAGNVAGGSEGFEGERERPTYYAKTLTQSDANNGGGFSVPRQCAETIFPPLDYAKDPPVQNLEARDAHGRLWKFRHIYRGTPRRHLLTTGWSTFVNKKMLVAGDSVVFMKKSESGQVFIGIRRAKRKEPVSPPPNPNGWSFGLGGGGGGSLWSGYVMRGVGKVKPEAVVEALTLAATGQPFEVVYYPSITTTAFCVKASKVIRAMRFPWGPGTRVKMAFENEDSSRISWFMGTVAAVQVADQVHWPDSPWRVLEVTWDEPDSLQNVKRINPWFIEMPNMQAIDYPSFTPARKKPRLPPQQPDFTLDGSQFPVSSLLGNNTLAPSSHLCYRPDNTPAGIQGARHLLFGASITDLLLDSKLQSGTFASNVQQLNQHSITHDGVMTGGQTHSNDSLSWLLSMGNSSQNLEKSNTVKKLQFILFGQPIVIEQKDNSSSSSDVVSQVVNGKDTGDDPLSDAVSQVVNGKDIGDGNTDTEKSPSNDSIRTLQATESGLDVRLCKIFMEYRDLQCPLDLSALGSYEELYKNLASMFGTVKSELLNRVLYHDATGVPKPIEDKPYSEFMKTAKRLTITTKTGNNNTGRT